MSDSVRSPKKSIRFFNDREVRAIWDNINNRWLFSAIDIVRAINNEPDYLKASNYWRWIKRRLLKEGLQLVSATHGVKFDWSRINKTEYLSAMRESVVNDSHIRGLISYALTDKINDREMFMKGIDYSYYYEANE